jgi:hypothetical protein
MRMKHSMAAPPVPARLCKEGTLARLNSAPENVLPAAIKDYESERLIIKETQALSTVITHSTFSTREIYQSSQDT